MHASYVIILLRCSCNINILYSIVKNMEKNGIATSNDVLKVELQQSNIELARIDISNNCSIANYNFNILIGLPADNINVLDTIVTSSSASQPFVNYLQDALAKRYELKAGDLRTKAAEATTKFTKGNMLPTLSVGANYYFAKPLLPSPKYHQSVHCCQDTHS